MAITKLSKLSGILFAALIVIYIIGAVISYSQVSSNYGKWVSNNIKDYSISVSSGSPGVSANAFQSQSVAGDKVVKGYDQFNKPIIDWAFDQAKFCSSAWILCLAFKWSFQYDSVYGYPSYIEYDDSDGHYTITLKDLAPATQ